MGSKIYIKPKIILHCQYVYGIGHFVRALELASGLSKYFEVYIINGGESVPNFDLPETVKYIQLPAIYKEENSDFLLSVDSSFTIEECFILRKNIIKIFNIRKVNWHISNSLQSRCRYCRSYNQSIYSIIKPRCKGCSDA